MNKSEAHTFHVLGNLVPIMGSVIDLDPEDGVGITDHFLNIWWCIHRNDTGPLCVSEISDICVGLTNDGRFTKEITT